MPGGTGTPRSALPRGPRAGGRPVRSPIPAVATAVPESAASLAARLCLIGVTKPGPKSVEGVMLTRFYGAGRNPENLSGLSYGLL